MKRIYSKPDSELSETLSMLAFATSDPTASIEEFDSKTELLEW